MKPSRIGRMLRLFARCRRGASAVEFGILAPVLFAMLLGVEEVGRALWIRSALQFAVEETARYALANTSASDSTLQSYAAAKATDVSGVSSANFTISSPTSGGYTYKLIVGTYAFEPLAATVPLPAVTITVQSRVPEQ